MKKIKKFDKRKNRRFKNKIRKSETKINKLISDKIIELKNNKTFMKKLEIEQKNINLKNPEDLAKYSEKAFEISKKEIKNKINLKKLKKIKEIQNNFKQI